jgi:hypothetical protein
VAAVPDRLSRAIPFNPLKPFDGDGFADRITPRRCATAHFALLNRINHAVAQVLRITRATFNAILFPATRSALSEAKRCKIGVRRQWPEHEPSPSDIRFGQNEVPVTVPSRQRRASP